MPVYRLTDQIAFPNPSLATQEGLLAVGGDLSPERLLFAYSLGIFPWYGEDEPILWWAPDPRLVLFPNEIHVSRSLKKTLRQCRFSLRLDTAFRDVIRLCAEVRTSKNEPTWLLPEMMEAYSLLHDMGYAHCVEAWQQNQLVGGLYGVSLGRGFFAESMFHLATDASKVALAFLASWLLRRDFLFMDCQVATAHMQRMGARQISRKLFTGLLEKALKAPTLRGKWSAAENNLPGSKS